MGWQAAYVSAVRTPDRQRRPATTGGQQTNIGGGTAALLHHGIASTQLHPIRSACSILHMLSEHKPRGRYVRLGRLDEAKGKSYLCPLTLIRPAASISFRSLVAQHCPHLELLHLCQGGTKRRDGSSWLVSHDKYSAPVICSRP